MSARQQKKSKMRLQKQLKSRILDPSVRAPEIAVQSGAITPKISGALMPKSDSNKVINRRVSEILRNKGDATLLGNKGDATLFSSSLFPFVPLLGMED